MIKAETLHAMHKTARAPGYVPSKQDIFTLIQSNQELLQLISGGHTNVELEAEVRKGIKAIQTTIPNNPDFCDDRERALVQLDRARYLLHLVDLMVRTKPPRRKPWKEYLPQMEEEFDGADQ